MEIKKHWWDLKMLGLKREIIKVRDAVGDACGVGLGGGGEWGHKRLRVRIQEVMQTGVTSRLTLCSRCPSRACICQVFHPTTCTPEKCLWGGTMEQIEGTMWTWRWLLSGVCWLNHKLDNHTWRPTHLKYRKLLKIHISALFTFGK